MHWQFDYIKENIKPEVIKAIGLLDDESIKIVMAGFICKIVGGLKRLPSKKYKSSLAKELVLKGKNRDEILTLCEISKSTFYNIKRSIKNGKSKD